MRPRHHNVVSYSVTVLVFWAVFLWRERGTPWPRDASLGAALWTAHFVRRTLESALVHRYGKSRIAPGDFLTEYLYYWGFAAWLAWSLASPQHHTTRLVYELLGFFVFALAETGNARAHVMLRNLRAVGSRERQIPRGFLFEWVSCPHYSCEILAWVGFNLATQTLAGVSFMLVGAGILGAWAHARHVAYRTEFDGQHGRDLYAPNRRALIPGVF